MSLDPIAHPGGERFEYDHVAAPDRADLGQCRRRGKGDVDDVARAVGGERG